MSETPGDTTRAGASQAPHHLAEVRAAIAKACRAFDRRPQDVTLIAVSKTFPADAVRPVLEAGQRVFGENRVQEAQAKWPELRAAFPDARVHLIGPLQSNKVREAVELFDAIHTVDRPKIAAAIAAEQARTGRALELFVQVNTGAEPQKAGVLPEAADAFIAECRDVHGLTLSGLMCIPPADAVPDPHFALLAEIAARNGLKGLSMGMSGDFPAAIRQGATHIRVGSAIFGHRPPLT
ncbi:YggS family pyridoxal phosphate-dependent enzyme [Xanthobacter agilis]|uniref:Pyridoxal phosphate homeostasis protein n=1 Tax=Xanthobacter agilis TaxID=47492 RepID=A0ABU0L8Y9_XANAG|nr:YggS family pyridoxal phosphate-dependent enzyme [Xanthobacter agilis]MDQ0503584.1 pyridoxal phosphate enzyme (YggS family) [Xanthobacter agilis]